MPSRTNTSETKMPANKLKALIESILLQYYSPAAVLINYEGDILYISGKTGKYLEPASGKANLNIFAMAREGLESQLVGAVARAVRDQVTIHMPGVRVDSNDAAQIVDLTVQPLANPTASNEVLLIVFSDVSTQPEAQAPAKASRGRPSNTRLAEEVLELQHTREDLQSTREEMQTSQEELRSLNEEMQSTNEELQSSNEELTTSKEEMQSMNEELQSVNHELQSKVDELAQTSDDMNNLLERTDIATLFLDANLRVRRFTSQTAMIMKLIPGDVGRPFTDLVSDLDYPNLPRDAREVLKTLIFCERQIRASRERWYKVRIMPYRTQDNRIDGLLITFVDISEAKALEATLREALALLQVRLTDQNGEMDAIRSLDSVLVKAQAVFEKSLETRTDELRQLRNDLHAEKGRRL